MSPEILNRKQELIIKKTDLDHKLDHLNYCKVGMDYWKGKDEATCGTFFDSYIETKDKVLNLRNRIRVLELEILNGS